MIIVRELVLFYLFLFYVYFYFQVDEEFIVFIVIVFWILFFCLFYLKSVVSLFTDSMLIALNEYFFFHNKKNLFLSIVRDQYYFFIELNFCLVVLLASLFTKINQSLLHKLIKFHKLDLTMIAERLNVLKFLYKNLIFVYFNTVFALVYKLIFLGVETNLRLISFFMPKFYEMKEAIEGLGIRNDAEKLKVMALYPFFLRMQRKNLDLTKQFIFLQIYEFFKAEGKSQNRYAFMFMKICLFSKILRKRKLIHAMKDWHISEILAKSKLRKLKKE